MVSGITKFDVADIIPHIITIPSFSDNRGSLSVVEEGRDLPWPVAEAETIEVRDTYTPETQNCDSLIVPLRGSIEFVDDDSSSHLFISESSKGLFLPRGTEAKLVGHGALLLLLKGSSDPCKSSLPFPVRRVFYLHNLPRGSSRGAHAHRTHHQLIRAASGSFNVTIDDGVSKETHHIDTGTSLWVKPGIWNTLSDFSKDAICLVLASEPYNEALYIRDYDEFLRFRNIKK